MYANAAAADGLPISSCLREDPEIAGHSIATTIIADVDGTQRPLYESFTRSPVGAKVPIAVAHDAPEVVLGKQGVQLVGAFGSWYHHSPSSTFQALVCYGCANGYGGITNALLEKQLVIRAAGYGTGLVMQRSRQHILAAIKEERGAAGSSHLSTGSIHDRQVQVH